MSQSEHINELATAMSKVQLELKNAKLDSTNPHFKSNYASLESVINAIRPFIGKHGLSFMQTMEPYQDNMALVTTLAHTSGQWIKSIMPMKVDMTKPQAVGSFVSYYRRYSLVSMFGIADTDQDDDANEAQAAAPKYITEQQVKEIKTLLGEEQKINEWFADQMISANILDFSKIEVSKFTGICNAIKNQKAKMIKS